MFLIIILYLNFSEFLMKGLKVFNGDTFKETFWEEIRDSRYLKAGIDHKMLRSNKSYIHFKKRATDIYQVSNDKYTHLKINFWFCWYII